MRYATVGIFAEGSFALSISLSNTEVSNSLAYPVVTNANGMESSLNPSNTYLNNGREAIGAIQSTLTQAATWGNRLPIAVFDRGLAVQDGVNLNLQHGAVLKFRSNSKLTLNGSASLGAVGVCSPTGQVIFTSFQDDSFGGDTNGDGNATAPAAGDWVGVIANSTSSILFDSGTIRFANIGISANTSGSVSITNSNLTDNVEAVHNFRNSPEVNATGNWWGDPSGPFNLTSNPGGLGNPVSDFVDFSSSAFEPFCLITNRPPEVGSIIALIDPVEVNTQINASADFTDPDDGDTHTAVWVWGDGSSDPDPDSITEPTTTDPGSVTGSHTYTSAGVYTVTLTVTDSFNESDQATFQFVVIYDPDAGFVTGGGWIDSPPEAYTPNPSLSGKANFGFVSKYKKGQSIPDGNTQFNFHVADLNFSSTEYEWLVIAGPNAKYKGSGTINGNGNYGFMLTGRDGQVNGGGGVDKFRIKIWDKNDNDTVVYDNQLGDADDGDATDAIEGGSIVIHSQGQSKIAVNFDQSDEFGLSSLPEDYALLQNYPNPFNPETEIYFQLPEANHVVVAIFNTNGQEIRRLADSNYAAGYHSLRWKGMDNQGNAVSSGVYLYQLRTAAFSQVRKMSLMR